MGRVPARQRRRGLGEKASPVFPRDLRAFAGRSPLPDSLVFESGEVGVDCNEDSGLR